MESLGYYNDGMPSGDRRVPAKAITLIESRLADHLERGRLLLEELPPPPAGPSGWASPAYDRLG